ncbi:MAG: TMEM165/GDT1 family protein [Richelia sp. CSU_2_1]|nr:TMEM165/GDT1 family protein [Microcoleus sp. SM1_3_4]NJR24465.1 TMEM165/GDT1 family protein [Richelia sp. CSU_2_1]
MKLDSLPPSLPATEPANSKSPLPQVETLQKDILDDLAIVNSESGQLSDSPDPNPCQEQKGIKNAHWAVFASTFATIFLAEIGDKTQIAVLLMTAESRHPWIVFAGAGTALVATSFLGVWLGRWLAAKIPPRTLERVAGSSLLLISALLVCEIFSH